MKNKIAQIITINIKLQITIAAISPLLSFFSLLYWSGSLWHVSGNLDDFETLNCPNFSFEYVEYVITIDKFSHPENELSLIVSGLFVP